MGFFSGILSASSSSVSKDKTPSIDTTSTTTNASDPSVSNATIDKQPPSESVSDSNTKPKAGDHPGWDLPAHIIQLMSIPVDQAVAQLLNPPPPPTTITKTNGSTPIANAFMDAMKAVPNLTRTENGATAYTTTDSPLVDLFFDLSPPVDAEHLFGLLGKAWAVDPVTTMKIIFQARSIHEGKGYEQGFYRAMAWVYEHHPLTFLSNLHLIVDPTCDRQRDKERDAEIAKKKLENKGKDDMGVMELDDEDGEEPKVYPARPHGCYDDLNNILVLYVNGQFTTTYTQHLNAMNDALAPPGQRNTMRTLRLTGQIKKPAAPAKPSYSRGWQAPGRRTRKVRAELDESDPRKAAWESKTKIEKLKAVRQRFDKMITNDPKFQALYLVVVDLFTKQLKEDLKLYDQSRNASPKPTEIFGLSYAAKWTVTPSKGTDKQLLIASAIALKLFPGDGIKLARERLQREVLSPLRSMLNVPEVKMSAKQWTKIPYNKVPSRSMVRNTPYFKAHDPAGFDKYLTKVATGKTTISGAAIFPHEFLADAMGTDEVASRVADLHWTALVNSIKNSSTSALKNCLAVADVSGSMGSIRPYYQQQRDDHATSPIMPCVALTLLLSELAVEPWHGNFFTFSTDPSMEYIDPAMTLSERAQKLSTAHWAMSTNVRSVFRLILLKAKEAKLAPADMLSTLFIFSDMQFDACGGAAFGETVYQTLKGDFEAAGYQIPELVFWNLAGRASGTPKPVSADQRGVSLMSGYSGALMKYFLGRQAGEDEEEVESEGGNGAEDEDDMVVVGDTGKTESVKPKKTKKKDNPLETVMKVIAAPSFSGIKVVD